MYQVVKRDGKITEFEISKISKAITKAFEALGKQYHPSVIDMLALRVTAEYEPLIRDNKIAVETIQDCVEKVLSEAGYADVAKAYILYRKQREKVRNVNSALLMEGRTDYEFRTTVVAELHDADSFRGIGEWIRGARRYFLQKFTDRDTVPFGGFHAPADDEMRHYAEIARKYVSSVEIRGMTE